MPRIFVPAVRIVEHRIRLTPAEARHLLAVRLRAGATLVVFDDRGCEHDAVVEQLSARAAALEIRATRPLAARRPGPAVTLMAAILKGPRMDLLVEKATELGAARIVPILTRFTVARPGAGDGARLGRWRRLTIAAATQCGRPDVPEVSPPVDFAAAVAATPPGALGVLFWEERRTVPLSAVYAAHPRAPALVVVVGPEGGFDRGEIETARAAGFEISGLGPRTLRAETAAIVALTLCQATWGDLAAQRNLSE